MGSCTIPPCAVHHFGTRCGRSSQAVGIAPTTFSIAYIPATVGLENCFRAAVLGVLCAVLSVLFCIVMEHVGGAYRRIFKNPFVRVFCGGCIVIAATYLVGCRDYNGAGMNIIAQALQGDAKAEAFLLKILFTALTLGAGFKGGEIVPSFFIGATFGCVAGPLLGLSRAVCGFARHGGGILRRNELPACVHHALH